MTADRSCRAPLLLRGLLALSAFVFACMAGAAPPASELDWEGLVPPLPSALQQEIDTLLARLDAMSDEERDIFNRIDDEMTLRKRIDDGAIKQADLLPHERAMLEENLSGQHPDMRDTWLRRLAARGRFEGESKNTDASLDGRRVRMPGYVLPLEHEGKLVREFLLVPFVGACIHAPPPPANQMVFVRADKPFASEGLYEPVWVEGVMSTRAGEHMLSLVDGQGKVESGYSMDASRIERFTEDGRR